MNDVLQELIKWPFSGINFSINFPDLILMVLTQFYFKVLKHYLKSIKGGKKNLNQYWSYLWKRVSEVNYKTDLYSITKKLQYYVFFLPRLILFR